MSRSAYGESSIHQDAAGRWHGYVSMGLKREGQRDRRHVSAAKRAEVVRKVRALEQQRDSGVAQAAGRAPTVAEWLGHWLDTIAIRKVRASTLQGYRGKVNSRIISAVGHHRLDRLQPEHLEAWYIELAEEGLASSTILQLHRILSRALKVAMQRGKIARNVCSLVDAPSLRREEVVPFSTTEARALLAAARGLRNEARWSVALALGLRQGEALALRWEDIDLDTGTLTVKRSMQHLVGKGLVFDEPKSRAGRRTIMLPNGLRDALRAHRAAQLEERLAAGSEWQEHGLLFAQVNGRPIDPGSDWKSWKALLALAGVRDAAFGNDPAGQPVAPAPYRGVFTGTSAHAADRVRRGGTEPPLRCAGVHAACHGRGRVLSA